MRVDKSSVDEVKDKLAELKRKKEEQKASSGVDYDLEQRMASIEEEELARKVSEGADLPANYSSFSSRLRDPNFLFRPLHRENAEREKRKSSERKRRKRLKKVSQVFFRY